MKLGRLFLFAASGVLAAALAAPAQPLTDAPAPPSATAPQPDRLAPFLQAIREASDPSAAIDAYARAFAVAPQNVAVQESFVCRMVDFDLPEMADVQAQDLLKRDPDNGLGWAVAAYMNAKRDQPAVALGQIRSALRRLPDDPFVLRTAGQIVAWYDTKALPSETTEAIKAQVTEMKSRLFGRPAFAEAYNRARQTYQQIGEASPQPEEDSSQPLANAHEYTAPTYQPGVSGYENATPYPAYVYPSYAYGYPAYGPSCYWWPSAYASVWWWPVGPRIIVIDHHHHHRDHFIGHHPLIIVHGDRHFEPLSARRDFRALPFQRDFAGRSQVSRATIVPDRPRTFSSPWDRPAKANPPTRAGMVVPPDRIRSRVSPEQSPTRLAPERGPGVTPPRPSPNPAGSAPERFRTSRSAGQRMPTIPRTGPGAAPAAALAPSGRIILPANPQLGINAPPQAPSPPPAISSSAGARQGGGGHRGR